MAATLRIVPAGRSQAIFGMGAREYPRADPRFSVALMGAAEAGDAPAVKEALAAGQKPEQRNEAGQTPLSLASKSGSTEVVGILLEAGADVNQKCHLGRTALHYAARYGHADIVEKICTVAAKQELNVDAVDKAGWTPLHIASEKGHVKAAKALLSHKADLARTIEGTNWTPLFLASDRAHEATVALLLKAGGDAKAKLGNFRLTEFAGRFASDTQQDRIRVLIDPTYQPPERDEKKAKGTL